MFFPLLLNEKMIWAEFLYSIPTEDEIKTKEMENKIWQILKIWNELFK